MATLIQTYRNSARPHHSAGLRNAHVWAISLRPCGEHHCHTSTVVRGPSPVIFCGWRAGRSYVTACVGITYLLCHYTLPAFLKHKPFNTLFIFSSQEFVQNLICVENVYLTSLPSAFSLGIRIYGRKRKLICITAFFILWVECSLVIVYLALKCSDLGKWAFVQAAGRTMKLATKFLGS